MPGSERITAFSSSVMRGAHQSADGHWRLPNLLFQKGNQSFWHHPHRTRSRKRVKKSGSFFSLFYMSVHA